MMDEKNGLPTAERKSFVRFSPNLGPLTCACSCQLMNPICCVRGLEGLHGNVKALAWLAYPNGWLADIADGMRSARPIDYPDRAAVLEAFRKRTGTYVA